MTQGFRHRILSTRPGRLFRGLYRFSRSTLEPYLPLPGGRALLDAQYAEGVWDYLRGVGELSRFSVVAGYCHYFKQGGRILELGCGEGLHLERLDLTKISRYVGVDISAEAIARAVHRHSGRSDFVTADAAVYWPDESFDVVVFNECLEYFKKPLWLLQRYEEFLRPEGVYIVSMFSGPRVDRIWQSLQGYYEVSANTLVSTKPSFSWRIKVLVPRAIER